MSKLNPFLEAMIVPVLVELAKVGSDTAFQKMVDHDQAKAATVLQTLNKSIVAVAKANKISLK
mgnify:CR=1 FL=1